MFLKIHYHFIGLRQTEEDFIRAKSTLSMHIEDENKRLGSLYPISALNDKPFIVMENYKMSPVMRFEEAYLLDRKISMEGGLEEIFEFLDQLDLVNGQTLEELSSKYPDFFKEDNNFVLFGDYQNKPPSNPGDLIADCRYFVLIKV